MNIASAFAKKLDDFYAWKCPVNPNCSQLVKELADAVRQNPTDYAARLILADALEDEGGHDQTAETQRHIAKRLSQFSLMMKASYGDLSALVEFMSQMESENLYLLMGRRDHKINPNRVCKRCGKFELDLMYNREIRCEADGLGPVCSVIQMSGAWKPPMPLSLADHLPFNEYRIGEHDEVRIDPFCSATYHPHHVYDTAGNWAWAYSDVSLHGGLGSVLNRNWCGTIVDEFQDWNR